MNDDSGDKPPPLPEGHEQERESGSYCTGNCKMEGFIIEYCTTCGYFNAPLSSESYNK